MLKPRLPKVNLRIVSEPGVLKKSLRVCLLDTSKASARGVCHDGDCRVPKPPSTLHRLSA
jgi:hypothetical protein